MANRYWQYHGNSQENQAFSYPIKYAANTAAGAVDLQLRSNTNLVEWIADQPTVIAALRATGTNIVSSRLSATQTYLDANFGGSIDNWETAVRNFCLGYMSQNCFFCAITSFTAVSSQANNDVQRECDSRIRLFGNQYYHGLADIGANLEIGSSAPFPLKAEYDGGGGHLNDAGNVIWESIMRPQLDSLGRRFGLLRLVR